MSITNAPWSQQYLRIYGQCGWDPRRYSHHPNRVGGSDSLRSRMQCRLSCISSDAPLITSTTESIESASLCDFISGCCVAEWRAAPDDLLGGASDSKKTQFGEQPTQNAHCCWAEVRQRPAMGGSAAMLAINNREALKSPPPPNDT